jgi:osmoprotectant transport system permease protein
VLRDSEQVVVIGAKTFTEQYVLAEIVARRLRDSTGSVTAVKQSLGSSVVFDALTTGDVDVYVDYTGTLWTNVLKRSDRPRDRVAMLDELTRQLREKYGIRLLCPLGFENTYALAMAASRARGRAVRPRSDQGAVAPKLAIGGDYEFFGRPEWRVVADRYGLHFREHRSMDASLMYEAVARGAVDVVSAFSTDGRIAAFDLTVLEDDRSAIPPYDAVLLMGSRLSRQPRAVEVLRGLCGRIGPERMRKLNLAVDEAKHSPAEVARTFIAHRMED